MLDLREDAVDSRADAYPSQLSLPMPFKCVEHLYAYLMQRGQCHGTEKLYDVVRAGSKLPRRWGSQQPTPSVTASRPWIMLHGCCPSALVQLAIMT